MAGEHPEEPAGQGPSATSWRRVAVGLGLALILIVSTVAAVALWPREPEQSADTLPTQQPTSPSPLPLPAAEPSPTAEPSPAETDDVVELSPADLARRFGSAVWRVEATGCGYQSIGSAFAVDDQTLITNAHVVANDAKPILMSRDGTTSLRTVVVGVDTDVDIAVLETERDLPGEALRWIGADDLTEGQPLVALGYPVPDSVFTVSPATVMSFQADGGVRQAVRLDGRIDKGSSGGPVLTGAGEVAGVVTFLLGTGQHWIGVAHTHDYVADSIEGIENGRPGLDVSCDDIRQPLAAPDDWDAPPVDDDTSGYGYGVDPYLDQLYDACGDGDLAACDDLYWQAPFSSDYERFAATCGDTTEPRWGSCAWSAEPGDSDGPETLGDDPYLDDLWIACADGDPAACDDLFYESPLGSDYERFGATCGDTGAGYGACQWEGDEDAPWQSTRAAMQYGDNPYLDDLWDGCEAGDLDACDALYYDSPFGSDYEYFGATCGGHIPDPWPGFCYESAEDN